MPKITIDLTAQQAAALTDITSDPQDFIGNFVLARVDAAVAERKASPLWPAAAAAFAATGGDAQNDLGVFAHAMAAGTFKDAATRQQEVLAAIAAEDEQLRIDAAAEQEQAAAAAEAQRVADDAAFDARVAAAVAAELAKLNSPA